MKASFIPYPDPLNANSLRDFLKETGVDSGRVEDMVAAVEVVVARYAGLDTASNLGPLKEHLKDVHDAAEKFAEALQPRQYSNDVWRAIEEAYCTNRNGVQTDADGKNVMRLAGQWRDRIGHQQNFQANIALIRDEAKEALDRLKKPGRPIAGKTRLFQQLKLIWGNGTGTRAAYFGGASWNAPGTDFGKFIKISVQMLPCTHEFEIGFADMLRPPRG